jgi:hypothetical protein
VSATSVQVQRIEPTGAGALQVQTVSTALFSTAGAPAGSSVSAVQTVTVTATDGASALAGQLELSYSGVVIGGALTAPFTSTSVAETQLNGIAAVAALGGVTVAVVSSTTASTVLSVTFGGANAGDVLTLGAAAKASSSPNFGVAVVVAQRGSVNEAQRITAVSVLAASSNPATAGTFALSFAGEATVAMPCGASAAHVKAALEQLSTVHGAVDVALVDNGVTTTAGLSGLPTSAPTQAPTSSIEVGGAPGNMPFEHVAPTKQPTMPSPTAAPTQSFQVRQWSWDIMFHETSGDLDLVVGLPASSEAQFFGAAASARYGHNNCGVHSVSSIREGSSLRLGGTFDVSFGGSSVTVAYDASAAVLEAQLALLPLTVPVVSVVAVDTAAAVDAAAPASHGRAWAVTFQRAVGGADIAALGVDASALTGTGATASISATVSASANLSGGFTLTWDGVTTPTLAVTASAADVQTQLRALTGLGGVIVTSVVDDDHSTRKWDVPTTALGTPFSRWGASRWDVTFAGHVGVVPAALLSGTADIAGQSVVVREVVPATTRTIQELRLSATSPLAGSFTIAFRGYVTTELVWSAMASEVESALEALPTIGDVIVTRSDVRPELGHYGYQWQVTFIDVAGTVPLLAPSAFDAFGTRLLYDAVTNGASVQVACVTTAWGTSAALGGSFTLSLAMQSHEDPTSAATYTTAPLAFDASAAAVETALELIPGIDAVSVTALTPADAGGVSILEDANNERAWHVVFDAPKGPQSTLSVDAALLTGSQAQVVVTRTTAGAAATLQLVTLTIDTSLNAAAAEGYVQCNLGAASVSAFIFANASAEVFRRTVRAAIAATAAQYLGVGDDGSSLHVNRTALTAGTVTWVVEFVGYAGDAPLLTCTTASSGLTVAVTKVRAGSAVPLGGTFRLQVGTYWTSATNAATAPAADVDAALEAAATLAGVNSDGHHYSVSS